MQITFWYFINPERLLLQFDIRKVERSKLATLIKHFEFDSFFLFNFFQFPFFNFPMTALV